MSLFPQNDLLVTIFMLTIPKPNQINKEVNTHLLTYLLTPCSKVLLEKLTSLQLVKKFPTFYGTQRFILPWPKKNLKTKGNKQFINFKTRVKQEQAVTLGNPAAQMHPVHDSSSFVPILILPNRTCPHSASSILAVHISCHVITAFVFRKPLFIN
jgi:hypothetical protein